MSTAQRVGQQSLSGGVDGRYALGPAALLFTSRNPAAAPSPGFVNSIQFVNGCDRPAAIAALGGPSASRACRPAMPRSGFNSFSPNASLLTSELDRA